MSLSFKLTNGVIASLFLLFVFAGCRKKNDVIETGSSSFTQSEITVSANSGKGSFIVKWSLTEWEITTGGTSFLSNFSPQRGGSKDRSSSTQVTFDYSANPTSEERIQEVFLTNKSTGEKTKISIKQGVQAPVEVTMSTNTSYQQITGFGGMNNVWAAPMLTLDEVQKMYSTDGLGYNMMRIMIWPNKNDWGRDVATTLKAQSLGARILASPWTPPSAMKSSNSNLHGYLLPEKYGDYVQHLNDFIDYMKAQGITIEAVSIQNEPDWSPEYDGCEWSPEQIRDFIKNHAGAIKAKVLAAEAVNFKKMFTDPVLNDPVAVNNLDIVGGHLYGGGLVDYPLAREKGKEIWMTEHLLNEVENGMGWNQALVFAKELNDCMHANFNAYFWWYLKRSYSMLGDGDKGTVMGETMKRGYVLSHYAKYATGRRRIQINKPAENNDIHLTAYSGDKDLTVVILNLGTSAVPAFRINLPVSVKNGSAIETSEAQNIVSRSVLLNAEKTIATVNIPAKSIMSVKFEKN